MIEYELKIIKKTNFLIITTDDKYDINNEEYFKIPPDLITMIYNFFAIKYKIIEISELICNEKDKVQNEKVITLNQTILQKLVNRIMKSVTGKLVFKKFESSNLDNEYIEELYLVGDTNEKFIFENISTINVANIEELTEQLIKVFPFVMTIFESSEINIHCKDTSYLESLLESFTVLEKTYNMKVYDNI